MSGTVPCGIPIGYYFDNIDIFDNSLLLSSQLNTVPITFNIDTWSTKAHPTILVGADLMT